MDFQLLDQNLLLLGSFLESLFLFKRLWLGDCSTTPQTKSDPATQPLPASSIPQILGYWQKGIARDSKICPKESNAIESFRFVSGEDSQRERVFCNSIIFLKSSAKLL